MINKIKIIIEIIYEKDILIKESLILSQNPKKQINIFPSQHKDHYPYIITSLIIRAYTKKNQT